MTFAVKRSLMNPKFDGYKLFPLPESDTVSTISLPSDGISQATVSANAHLYFQEVQSRVRHNHLAIANDSGASSVPATFAYIDKNRVFTTVIIDQTYQIQFNQLFEIPENISSSTADKEYPTALSLSENLWLISDGSGRLYLLQTTVPATTCVRLGNYEVIANNNLSPCRLHSAIVQDSNIVFLISRRGDINADENKKRTIKYELAAMRVPILSEQTEDVIQAETLWRKQATDIPSYVNYQAGNWLVCAGAKFKDIVAASDQDTMKDVSSSGMDLADDTTQPTGKPPPPYSWNQTDDSVTVAFPLPSSTPKGNIHVTIGPKHLSILVKGSEDDPFPLPRYAMKELWEVVDKDNSLWTWDKEGEKTVGLLTLHLEKRYVGRKWSHVFAREGTAEEEEVPETVDPSELWKIREALEKYTSDIRPDGEGLGMEMPSLAAGELDPSVDTEVGRNLIFSYFDALNGEELCNSSSPQEILAFPLPHSPNTATSINPRSLVTKKGIDGPIFAGPIVPSVDGWEHTGTFPALAFVLASKRDTRFVFHIGTTAVVALESGGRDAGPNMYIYHDAEGKTRAKQGVVKIGSDGRFGALIGVAGFENDNRMSIICLREKELVIIKDFL